MEGVSIIVDDGSTIEGDEDRADGNTREDIFKGIFMISWGSVQ